MARPQYYDRAGNPISIQTLEHLFREADYRIVKQSRDLGKLVSTVWLGIDHASYGPPMIFETMVFRTDPSSGEVEDATELACARYSTLVEALAGHEEMCLAYIQPLDLMVQKLKESDASVDDSD
ncbi:MAG: hypothetical protein AB7L09_02965 [Nitrospira sp.]